MNHYRYLTGMSMKEMAVWIAAVQDGTEQPDSQICTDISQCIHASEDGCTNFDADGNMRICPYSSSERIQRWLNSSIKE